MLRTRAQEELILAEEKVSEVARLSAGVQSSYRSLCQSFPVMVRTCGLCQAVAFSKDKATGDDVRGQAHRRLLQHVAAILKVNDPLDAIRAADTLTYMRHTRQVLSAWIYFKRFAVSLLDESTERQNGAVSGSDGTGLEA